MALAPLALAACGRRKPGPLVDQQVETDGDLLAFRPRELVCRERDRVRLTFRHNGRYADLQHRWVLILPRALEGVTALAEAAGIARGWLPEDDRRVLAATPLCGRGQVVTAEFTAPEPGDYPFICTVPMHARSMWGLLHVLPAA
jgi:azurin